MNAIIKLTPTGNYFIQHPAVSSIQFVLIPQNNDIDGRLCTSQYGNDTILTFTEPNEQQLSDLAVRLNTAVVRIQDLGEGNEGEGVKCMTGLSSETQNMAALCLQMTNAEIEDRLTSK